MYSQMNCLIENKYIRELSTQKKKSPMYSQMNCLIENEHIRELPPPKKITYVFPNELPNWERIHKGTSPPKKITYVFPNELPNWKRILKGKKWKNGKKVGVLYYGGGLLIFSGSWRTLFWGGLLIPCWHYIYIYISIVLRDSLKTIGIYIYIMLLFQTTSPSRWFEAYLPDCLHFSPLCFVDVAWPCIHQATGKAGVGLCRGGLKLK